MTVTLKDLAAELGISSAAVSMALNGKNGVSEHTRAKVLETASKLGYKANTVGKALRKGQTGNVGVYVPSSALDYSHYYAEVTRGIVSGLTPHNLNPVLLPSAHSATDISHFPAVDGYIIVEPHADDAGVRAILNEANPVVCIDPAPREFPHPTAVIEADTATSTEESFNYLSSKGCKQPALLTIETVSEWSRVVEESYRNWCKNNHFSPVVLHCDAKLDNSALEQVLQKAITQKPHPVDGLFICADGFAVRVAGVLRQLGKTLSTDFWMVSGCDSTIMQFHTPAITAVDMDPVGFGQTAAETLAELLTEPQENQETSCATTPVSHMLPAPLVIRET